MTNLNPKSSGYICVPYKHDKLSIKIKDLWTSSRNIKSIHFVTITFSEDSKPYFPSSTNHYLLAKFADNKKILQQAQNLLIITPHSFFLLMMNFSEETWEMNVILSHYIILNMMTLQIYVKQE